MRTHLLSVFCSSVHFEQSLAESVNERDLPVAPEVRYLPSELVNVYSPFVSDTFSNAMASVTVKLLSVTVADVPASMLPLAVAVMAVFDVGW